MLVHHAVAEINEALSSYTSEGKLLALLSDRLSALRYEYRMNKRKFAPAQVAALQHARAIHGPLEDFIYALEDLKYVRDQEDAADLGATLKRLVAEFEGLPVQKRVFKELRSLEELSRSKSSSSSSAGRMNARIATLEAEHRNSCGRGHPMVVRYGPDGSPFWGLQYIPSVPPYSAAQSE